MTSVATIAEAVDEGLIGERVWFYANYHCNLACTYCLTESSPTSLRRALDPTFMLERAHEARELGFKSLGVTGGEPFMVASMPLTVAALSRVLPTVVLSNATLFDGTRLDRVAEHLAGADVHVQVSLDAPEETDNDSKRGLGNWTSVAEAVPRLVARGVKVRLATTSEGLRPDDLARLCALHRGWGVADADHVVRPVVARGRAALAGMGIDARAEDFSAELCITTDGAYWSAFGPTVRNGRVDTDLLVTRTTAPLRVPASAMLRLATARQAGADASLGIR